MLMELTKQYIQSFDNKDLEAVSNLLADGFVLEDPVVKRLEGAKNALQAIESIFSSCDNLSFTAKNIYQDNNTTLIEFCLVLDDTELTGVDIIEWESNKMTELRAYLDVPAGDDNET